MNLTPARDSSHLFVALGVSIISCLMSELKNSLHFAGNHLYQFSLFTMTSLFGTYINYATASMENLRVFGSVTLFVLMLWFIVFARILILGAVLNASYQKNMSKNSSLEEVILLRLFNPDIILFNKDEKKGDD